jgi:hypothetical protein
MKRVFSIIAMAMLVAWFAGCEKNTYNVTERTEITGKAMVKFGYFVPASTNQPVQVKVDGNRMSPTLPYNTPFPGGGLNTGGLNNSDFLVFEPGSYNIQLSVPKVGTETDSVKIFEKNITFGLGRQTLFLTDSLPNVTEVLLETETPPTTDSGKVRVKFINLIPNTPVDFYRAGVKIKGNIAYKESTEWFDMNAGSSSYVVKQADSTANLHDLRTINPAAGRIYVFLARGYKGGTGTQAPNTSAVIIQ